MPKSSATDRPHPETDGSGNPMGQEAGGEKDQDQDQESDDEVKDLEWDDQDLDDAGDAFDASGDDLELQRFSCQVGEPAAGGRL